MIQKEWVLMGSASKVRAAGSGNPPGGGVGVFAILRVVGAWVTVLGGFVVAVAVTGEVFGPNPDTLEDPCPPSRSYVIEVKPAGNDSD